MYKFKEIIMENELTPLVTICMITYNHEKYIKQAIEGVLMQETNFQYELIVANDSSTDRTNGVIENIIQTHSKGNLIKYFYQVNNLGMMSNFIFALEKSSGKYIALCEGDDYWTDSKKLQKQVDFLEANEDFVVTHHDSLEINAEGHVINKYNLNSNQKEVTTIEDLSKGNYIYTASSVFKNIKKNLPNWFSEINAGDYPLHLLLAKEGNIKFFNEKMSAYRIHSGGIFTNSKRIDLLKGNEKLFKILLENFENQTRKNLKYQYKNILITLLDELFDRKDFREYIKYFFLYLYFFKKQIRSISLKQINLLILNKLRVSREC